MVEHCPVKKLVGTAADTQVGIGGDVHAARHIAPAPHKRPRPQKRGGPVDRARSQLKRGAGLQQDIAVEGNRRPINPDSAKASQIAAVGEGVVDVLQAQDSALNVHHSAVAQQEPTEGSHVGAAALSQHRPSQILKRRHPPGVPKGETGVVDHVELPAVGNGPAVHPHQVARPRPRGDPQVEDAPAIE